MSSLSIDIQTHLTGLLRAALASVAPGQSAQIHLERPRDCAHGDFASNLALQIASTLKENPRKIAERLVRELPRSDWVQKAEVAGAGFINFTVTPSAKTAVVHAVLASGDDYGRGAKKPGKMQVEFVSANPTGPLHVGHGRGAAFGASLANLLAFAGHEVTREYYVNDAGRQMDILALSTWLRYLEIFGEDLPFPPNAYQGDYVREMAAQIRDAHAGRYVRPAATVLAHLPQTEDIETRLDALIQAARHLLGEDWHYIHQHALSEQLADCRADLEEYGVRFDYWFSERSLHDTGMVARAVAALEKRGHLYVQDGAKWFRSTAFGDEKDRVVQRENGHYTYFASDIAYHWNKFERGFTHIVDVWGADHHGYIPRVKGALQALGLPVEALHVALVQFVSLWRGTEKISMSTRAGSYVSLRELREEVGNDACRFFYLLRKQDLSLDFDLELAKSQSTDNPVYYVQYAHARICSVLAQWDGELSDLLHADLSLLTSEQELALAAKLSAFPEVVEVAARDYAPHAIAFWLRELAAQFHAWYNAERLLVEDAAQRDARLALAVAVRQLIRNGLHLLGVAAPESM